jgi:glutaredoxin 3
MNKPSIMFYSAPDCPHCLAGRAWLRERDVDFVEYDVSADYRALCDMLFQFGRAEVPALFAGYKAATGFDPSTWQEILDHAAEVAHGDPFALPPEFGHDPIKL